MQSSRDQTTTTLQPRPFIRNKNKSSIPKEMIKLPQEKVLNSLKKKSTLSADRWLAANKRKNVVVVVRYYTTILHATNNDFNIIISFSISMVNQLCQALAHHASICIIWILPRLAFSSPQTQTVWHINRAFQWHF